MAWALFMTSPELKVIINTSSVVRTGSGSWQPCLTPALVRGVAHVTQATLNAQTLPLSERLLGGAGCGHLP